MKTKIQYIIGIIIISAFSLQINAQNSVNKQKGQASITETFKVWGTCDMCKKTIETSAKKVVGVQSAVWDTKSKNLTVVYSGANKRTEVQQAVAKSGYDTENIKAVDDAYNKLPSCCKYVRK